jgi:hypothetical protein
MFLLFWPIKDDCSYQLQVVEKEVVEVVVVQ